MGLGLGRRKKWALGILLVAGALAAILSIVSQAETRARSPRGASGIQPLAASGPQRWTLSDRTVQVSSTYYVVMPRADGSPAVMFVAEVIVDDPNLTMENISERGDAAALPLMQHALREGLHERVPIGTRDGSTVLGVEWIGVVFLVDAGAFANSGYRTRRTIAEIRATLAPPP